MKSMKMVYKLCLVLITLLVILWIGFDIYHLNITSFTEDDVKKVIDSNVSIGDSVEKVVSFLDSTGVDHHTYKERHGDDVILFWLKDTSRSVIVRFDTEVKLYLDQSGGLAKYTIKSIGYEDFTFKRNIDTSFFSSSQ